MLFKKNPQPEAPANRAMTEQEELEALESQLDFLRKPSPKPKLKTPEMIAQEKEQEIHVVPGNAIPTPDSVLPLEQMPTIDPKDSVEIQGQPEAAVLPDAADAPANPDIVQGNIMPSPADAHSNAVPTPGVIQGNAMPVPADAHSNAVPTPGVIRGNTMPAPAGVQSSAVPTPGIVQGNAMPKPPASITPVPSKVQIPQPQGTLPLPGTQPQQPFPQAYAIQNTNANPVAPAVVPPAAVRNPNVIPPTQVREVPLPPPEPPKPAPLTPRPLQEAAAESAAAQAGKTVQIEEVPRTQNKWGRQMDYKTAVVKPGGQSNSIMTSNRQEAKKTQGPSAPIKNPLPTPKKHVAKEMEFDFQPNNTMMHFDLVDMTGIDHFDLN